MNAINRIRGMLVHELQARDPTLIGPYRVVGRLGGGGMGQVFLGRSPGGRLLAIKVIRAELAGDSQFRTRFRREVAAARSVSGLFTADVVDADVEAPVPWLATAYVAGSSLADTVARHGPLPAPSVLALAAGLAEGLLAIHSAGLVHRDIKPSNVLMADDGPRVIDFGISRAMEASTVTSTGMVVGSPGFMSPEQAEGHEVGPSSDVFSLGAVLTFAATGEGPFGTGSSAALIYRLVHNPPNLNRVPDEIRPLIERCLDKDSGGRPSPSQLLAELGSPGLAPGWLPESPVRDVSPPGPATARLAEAGGIMADDDRTGAPDDPRTVPAHQSRTAVSPWPEGISEVMPVSRRPSGSRRRLVIAGLVAALIAVTGGTTAWFLSANSGHLAAQDEPEKAPTQATASRSFSPAASASAATSATSGAKASPTPSAEQESSFSPARLTGTWTGTYFCSQGWTGVRLVLKATSSGSLTATANFYALNGNPGVPSGSYALTGSYSAQGFQLTPDYWISEPPAYVMVGLIATAPGTSDAVLNGEVVGPGCTTFSVSR